MVSSANLRPSLRMSKANHTLQRNGDSLALAPSAELGR